MTTNPTADIPEEDVSHREIEIDGSKVIRNGLTVYGKSILQDHFPQAVDGLKTLYRRSIWAARKFPATGQNGTGAVGQIKEYHDHGDDAIYTALARMSQIHQFNPTLMTFHGSVGDYMNDKPAASRYVGLSLSSFSHDVFFEGIEVNAIPMMRGMDLQISEPQYLAPAVPMGIVLGNTTVGYGYGSKLPARNFADICDVVAAYCRHLEKGRPAFTFDITKYADKLIPDFALPNVITNHRELLAAYKKGNFDQKIDLEGTVVLNKDSIEVFTLPVGRDFDVVGRIRKAITDAKDKKKSNRYNRWIEQNIVDANADTDRVTIQLKRNATTVFEAWEYIRKLIGFYDAFHPNQNYVDVQGYIYEMSPQTVLDMWYRKRHDLLLSSKRRRLRSLSERMRILDALLIVCKTLEQKKAILDMLQVSTNEKAVKSLVNTYGMTLFQAEHIMRAPLNILTTSEAEALLKQRADLQDRIDDLQRSFGEIPKEIAAKALDLKRRYGRPRISTTPNYIGYVSVLGGCVQFERPSEVQEILTQFPRTPIGIYMYDGPNIMQVDMNGKVQQSSVSKYTAGDIYGLPFDGNSGYTVNIGKDNTACCVRGICPGLRSEGYFYTTKKSIIIRRTGALEHVQITDSKVVSQRKTICRGATTNIVHVYPEVSGEHFIITASDADPNIVTLQRVNDETKKILISPAGEVKIEHHVTGKDWYFTLPETFINRINARGFHIPDASVLLDGARTLRIDLGSNKWKRGNSAFRMLN